jgi:hypothetical protein
MPYLSCNIKHLCEGSISRKDTGLGNTLFQLATQYSFAKRYGYKLDLRELEIYVGKLQELDYDHDITILREFLRIFGNENIPAHIDYQLVSEEHNKGEIYDATFENTIKENNTHNIKLNGYVQSFKYFNEYRPELYYLFGPEDVHKELFKIQYPELFDENVICVSVHIRMNYANAVNYNSNFFIHCMDYFKDKYPDKKVHFFVFSNNHNDIRGWFSRDKYNIESIEGNTDYIDLWMMMLCNHNIISHSTFAWWGAYLNAHPDKEVFYPYDSLRVWWGQLLSEVQMPEREYEHFLPSWKAIKIDTLYSY